MILENKEFIIRSNILLNILISFFKFIIPGIFLMFLVYYFRTNEIITGDRLMNFFIVIIVFLFSFLFMFLVLYEQKKSISFSRKIIKYSDLFETKEFSREEVKKISYKKGILNSFVLKNDLDAEYIIKYVDVKADFDSFKEDFFKDEVEETPRIIKNKIKSLNTNQIKRKLQIEDIITGKKQVIIKHPQKKDDYFNMGSKKDNFIGVEKIKFSQESGYLDLSKLPKEEKFEVLEKLKKMQIEKKDIFKKIKELKK